MARNNGKIPLFLIVCMIAVVVMFILGSSRTQSVSRISDSYSMSCEDSQNIIANENTRKNKDVLDESVQTNLQSEEIELLCLMYHNVVADSEKQGDYEIRVSALEKDFSDLNKMGYKCVGCGEIKNILDKKQYGRYVMITFDDGFYGVYKHVPSLLKKYNMKAIVSVVGEYMDIADKQNYKTRCSYMNTEEVQKLAKNSRIEIAHHSYNLHHISNGRRGVKIKQGENEETYKLNFTKDTDKLANKLKSIGIESKVYCYPFGEFCKQSESVLKGMNYNITMTCAEKINYLKNKQSLFLIGRINRSAKYQNLNNLLLKACNKH